MTIIKEKVDISTFLSFLEDSVRRQRHGLHQYPLHHHKISSLTIFLNECGVSWSSDSLNVIYRKVISFSRGTYHTFQTSCSRISSSPYPPRRHPFDWETQVKPCALRSLGQIMFITFSTPSLRPYNVTTPSSRHLPRHHYANRGAYRTRPNQLNQWGRHLNLSPSLRHHPAIPTTLLRHHCAKITPLLRQLWCLT